MENVVKMMVRTPERTEPRQAAKGDCGQKDDFDKLLREKTKLSEKGDPISDRQTPQTLSGHEKESLNDPDRSVKDKHVHAADKAEQTLGQSDLNLLQASLPYQALALVQKTDEQPVDAAALKPEGKTLVTIQETGFPVNNQGGTVIAPSEIQEETLQAVPQADNAHKEMKAPALPVENNGDTVADQMVKMKSAHGAKKEAERNQTGEETGEVFRTAANLQAGEQPRAVGNSRQLSAVRQAEPGQEQEGGHIRILTGKDSLPEDLGNALTSGLLQRKGELTVELEPASLGKLTIKVVYEGGRAAVSIAASNPKTLEMLNQKAGELAGILEEKTGQATIVYTQGAHQEQGQYPADQEGRGAGYDRHQEREQKRQESDNFAQQLRLGLV